MSILRDINDSQIGTVLGTVMHTLGAIAFLGGLVGYLAWHRHLKLGHHHRTLLSTSAFLTYFAIVVNLVGGFMRTYETGHPHITQFAESAWVRAIVIKHVFLFSAYGAAAFLFEYVAPRQLKALRVGNQQATSETGHRFGVAVVLLGIVAAAFLGAFSQVVPLTSADDPMGDDPNNGSGNLTLPFDRYANSTGQLTGFVPTVDDPQSRGTFEVTEATVSLNATLVWNPPQLCVYLALLPPGETAVPPATCAGPGDGRLDKTFTDPMPGIWSYVVYAQSPISVAWELTIRMPQVPREQTVLIDTVTVAPGAGYEINTEMPVNGTIHWEWSSGATLHFNVHSHFDGSVQDYVDIDATSDKSSFTNNRTGGYSLYWTNSGAVPIQLSYRVYGDFLLDSIFP